MNTTSADISSPQPRPNLSPAFRIVSVRGIRSFSQAFLNVVTPLYLLSRGVSSTELGVFFTLSFLIGALMSIPVGVFADRWGRKPFLVAFTVLMFAWGAIFTFTTYLPLLVTVSIISGIGRGGGGMGGGQAGPFAPAESALLADLAPESYRRKVFSWNGVTSSLLAAAGAALAGLPVLLKSRHWFLLSSNEGLFALTMLLAAVSLFILISVHEPPRKPREEKNQRLLSKQSTRIVIYQSLVGGLNSFGIGFVNSLFVVWLHLRFGVGQASIGPVFTASYLLSAGSVWIASAMAGRVGSVRTIVVTRFVAAGLMLATALSPVFWVAIVFQILRTAATMMATPVRQSFTMTLYPSEERASASGFTGVIRRLTGAASPPITGGLFDAGQLEFPFFFGAAFQILSALLYGRYFSQFESADYGARDPNANKYENTPFLIEDDPL